MKLSKHRARIRYGKKAEERPRPCYSVCPTCKDRCVMSNDHKLVHHCPKHWWTIVTISFERSISLKGEL